MLPQLTPEQSKYTSEVLQKLIDIKMEKIYELGFSKVFKIINDNKQTFTMPVSEVIITPKDANHPNWAKTVESIKYIIDSGMDRIHGFYIEFNSSFTKFKKSTNI